MPQTPKAESRSRRAETHVYEGAGESIRTQRHAAAQPRRQSVKKAQPLHHKPLGRSEELKERQRAYQQEYRRPAQSQRRFQRPVEDALYDDFDAYDRQARKAYVSTQKKKKHNRHRGVWAVVIFLCLGCTAVIGLFLAPQLLGVQFAGLPNCAFVNGSIITLDHDRYEDYITYRRYMTGQTIFPGVYVDGVDVGGKTVEEARQAIAHVNAQGGGDFAITVNVGNMTWQIDSAQVPMTRNVDDILTQAYALGRGNTTVIRGTRVTPFQERLNTAVNLRSAPVALSTSLSYDRTTVRQMVESIAQYVNRDPINASVASFDFTTRQFTFNSDAPGAYISADDVYRQVIACLDSGDRYAAITVQPQIVLAQVTKAELMNSFRQISSYTTQTTSNANRNTNVDLSAAAINGTTVMPGETFSFNRATGQRTYEKGYRAAAAIAGGQSIDEIGGGVCQTSSTLFNAVARANLEIVDRSPHAWPSNYVDKGMDATVNWPNLDFQFKNNTDWPIFIVSYYKNRKVTVEIYGMALGEELTIDLESEVTRTINPPSETNYVHNPALAPGEEKITVEARKGYEVDTYKVWYQNGQEIKRELLFHSRYKTYQQTIEYN